MHAYSSFAKARRHHDQDDYFEMIFFGGVGINLLSNVFHCSLTVNYDDDKKAALGPNADESQVKSRRRILSASLTLKAIEKEGTNSQVV